MNAQQIDTYRKEIEDSLHIKKLLKEVGGLRFVPSVVVQ